MKNKNKKYLGTTNWLSFPPFLILPKKIRKNERRKKQPNRFSTSFFITEKLFCVSFFFRFSNKFKTKLVNNRLNLKGL